MTGTLSFSERQLGLLISVLLALMIRIMSASARHGAMSMKGFKALGLGSGLGFSLNGALGS